MTLRIEFSSAFIYSYAPTIVQNQSRANFEYIFCPKSEGESPDTHCLCRRR